MSNVIHYMLLEVITREQLSVGSMNTRGGPHLTTPVAGVVARPQWSRVAATMYTLSGDIVTLYMEYNYGISLVPAFCLIPVLAAVYSIHAWHCMYIPHELILILIT